MGFEKRILNEVEDVLERDRSASFTCGCLFVDCTEQEARKVFHRLSQEFGLGKVQVNGPIQGEYAYDFL